jgi:hypothetical protein
VSPAIFVSPTKGVKSALEGGIFVFAGASNLARPKDGHTHNATFRILDDRHFTSAWTFHENDPPQFTETTAFARIQ